MLINIHRLSSEAMLGHSHDFLHRADTRVILEAEPLGVGVLAWVQRAHERMAAVLSRRQQLDMRIAELTEAITAEDMEHDSSARALHGFLQAVIEASSDPAVIAEFTAARVLLFPDGLAVTNRSYTDEYGAALHMQERMTPEVRELLTRTRVAMFTLIEIYDRWIGAGLRLGELVRERARTEDLRRPRTEGEAATALLEARQVWLAAMRMALGALDHLPLCFEQKRAILAPIEHDIRASTRPPRNSGQAEEPATEAAGEERDG